MSAHTTDTWRLVDHGGRVAICAGDSNGTRVICTLKTCWDDEGNAEQRANARLIASAPTLLTENAHLRSANAALLALAKQYASECAECGGKGFIDRRAFVDESVGDQPCVYCADIREVIASAALATHQSNQANQAEQANQAKAQEGAG